MKATALLHHFLKRAASQASAEPAAQVQTNAKTISDAPSQLLAGKGPAAADNKDTQKAPPKPKVEAPNKAQVSNNVGKQTGQ